MQREQFLEKLGALAKEASESKDPTVKQSAVVLYGLSGAIKAGDDFFEPVVDAFAETLKIQREILRGMIARESH